MARYLSDANVLQGLAQERSEGGVEKPYNFGGLVLSLLCGRGALSRAPLVTRDQQRDPALHVEDCIPALLITACRRGGTN